MLYEGLDLMLYDGSGTQIIGACKGVDIEVTQDTEEIPSASSSAWKTYMRRRKGWNFKISNLVTATTLGNAPSMVGTLYTCKFYNGKDTTKSALLSGSAYCTQAKITEQKGSIAKGSFVFQGTGALS